MTRLRRLWEWLLARLRPAPPPPRQTAYSPRRRVNYPDDQAE